VIAGKGVSKIGPLLTAIEQEADIPPEAKDMVVLLGQQIADLDSKIRLQSRIETGLRRAVATEYRVRVAHIDVDVRVVLWQETPMHLNSLTPIRISGTPRSFTNIA
jgi:hypothetical protein